MSIEPRIEEKAPSSYSPDTKERLLDAAIRVFSKKGFQASSMRIITREAGTSLSAANYHFGSKEELLRAALRSRADVLNARRLDLLDQAIEAEGETLSVEAVLDAFVRPIFERKAEMKARSQATPGVAMRLYLDPEVAISRIRHEVFESTNQRFVEVMVSVLPGSTESSVAEAMGFVVGMVVYTVNQWSEAEEQPGEHEDEASRQLERVLGFAAAGVRAFVTGPSDSSSSGRGN